MFYLVIVIKLRDELEDTRGVIRIHKSKKKEHKVQKKKDKRKNNDIQNITHQAKDRLTGTMLKTGGEPRCSRRINSSCKTSNTRPVTVRRQ